jgi:hypothetical protein
MHSVVNKVLARNGMMASSFILHDLFRISSSVHKSAQHCKMTAQLTTIPPDTHSYLSHHFITYPVDTARQNKAQRQRHMTDTQITNKSLYMEHLI